MAIKDGTKCLHSFSPQQVIDCSSASGNYGCSGGLERNAYVYMVKKGLVYDNFYTFKAVTQSCKSISTSNPSHLSPPPSLDPSGFCEFEGAHFCCYLLPSFSSATSLPCHLVALPAYAFLRGWSSASNVPMFQSRHAWIILFAL